MVDLPPKYAVIPVALLYGDLPRRVALTGMRIYGLAWRHRYERTGPISEAELCQLTGLRRSQLYEHVTTLAGTGVLRYTNVGGDFRFWLSPEQTTSQASPEIRTNATLYDVVGLESNTIPSEIEDQQQQQARQSGNPDSDQERYRWLDEMGILEPVRSEVLRLEWVTAEYLEAWTDWYTSQDTMGVGFVVKQLRGGVAAPDTRRHEVDGRRYIAGEYAEFIRY